MEKRQRLTNSEIEKDIISALQAPPEKLEATYKKKWLFRSLLLLGVIVLGLIKPGWILWILLAMLVLLIGCAILSGYQARSTGSFKRRRRIDNYRICFENGTVWRVPKKLYRWSERNRMDDRDICASVHRDDTMIVVTEKRSGKIVVAYHTEQFVYQD